MPPCNRDCIQAALSSSRNTEAATPWPLPVIIVCTLTSKMACLSLQGCAHTAAAASLARSSSPTNLFFSGQHTPWEDPWCTITMDPPRLALTDPLRRLVVIFAVPTKRHRGKYRIKWTEASPLTGINKLRVSRVTESRETAVPHLQNFQQRANRNA